MRLIKVFLPCVFLLGCSLSLISQNPNDSVWGVYASGVGERLKVGMDPCWITYTVGLMSNEKIQRNVESGLMGTLQQNLNWYEATNLQRLYSRYFEDQPDGTYKLEPCEYPILTGTWICKINCPAGGEGKEASISQNGNKITFINEAGQSSTGNFLSRSSVVAGNNWSNLKGTINNQGRRINWNNGTVWEKK